MTEAVAQRCLIQKVFLKTPQNSQQNLCVGVSFLKKITGLRQNGFRQLSHFQFVSFQGA